MKIDINRIMVEAWNIRFPEHTIVKVKNNGKWIRTETLSRAWLLANKPVIILKDVDGYCSLDRVRTL